MKTYTLTESQLYTIATKLAQKQISESKKKSDPLSYQNLHKTLYESINEVIGWDLEKSDVQWVNDDNDGTTPWLVQMWGGSGYLMDSFGAWAFRGAEEALYKVVAWLDQNDPNTNLFVDDDYIEEYRNDLKEDGYDEDEINDYIDELYMYVDATMEGASQPHYIYSENLRIKEYDEKNFRY